MSCRWASSPVRELPAHGGETVAVPAVACLEHLRQLRIRERSLPRQTEDVATAFARVTEEPCRRGDGFLRIVGSEQATLAI